MNAEKEKKSQNFVANTVNWFYNSYTWNLKADEKQASEMRNVL